MMEFISQYPRISFSVDGKAELTFEAPRETLGYLEPMKGKALDVRITAHSEKRSMTQNAYLWALLGQLSKKIGMPKEECYRNYIRDYGEYEVLPIRKEASETFKRRWAAHGLGWICEEMRESKMEGYVNLIAYYGSSVYTRATMNPLLEAVIRDCEDQGIPTIGEKAKDLKNEN